MFDGWKLGVTTFHNPPQNARERDARRFTTKFPEKKDSDRTDAGGNYS
jgi:hypothetical protein